MTTAHRIMALVLVVVLGATVAGVVLTSDWRAQSKHADAARTAEAPPVDLQPLRTAKAMARLAATPEEQMLAQEALRISDREVDLAFAMALQEADEQPTAADEKTRKLEERAARRQKRLEEAQAQVVELTKLVAKASGSRKDVLQDQLEEAQAWEDVAQNALDDAKIDLQRAGGDKHAQIQQMEEEHSASEHEPAPANNAAGGKPIAAVEGTPEVPARSRGLLGRYQEWAELRANEKKLVRAQQDAQAAVVSLKKDHDELAERARAASAETAVPGQGVAKPANRAEALALLAQTKHLSTGQKRLVGYNRRIRDEEELSDIYSQWGVLVAGRVRTALHGLLLGVAVLLVVALVLLSIDGWSARFFTKLAPERKRLLTMRRVTRVGIQGAGVVVVLLVLFGPPGQLGMFLGFAGAGLTIALKDFIVGFFGWFVLMGKNGIRVGDWVEINGVSGEVVEIGLFHTVLLETGNWTDAGHPTGRRVTFVNSFAIERHYFNFSTSGQWLWDELSAVLPAGQDPYPVVEAIQKAVMRETAETARLAELEWTKATRSRGMSGFSAAPAITVRPGSLGFEVVVRYVTRANERHTLRARLYQAVVELMGGGKAPAVQQAEPARPAATSAKTY